MKESFELHKAEQDAQFQLTLDTQYDEQITELLTAQRLAMKEMELSYLAESQDVKRSKYDTCNPVKINHNVCIFILS